MFRLRLNKHNSDWIEFTTASKFYNYIDTQHYESNSDIWQWFDNLTGEWKHFSEYFVRGDKRNYGLSR